MKKKAAFVIAIAAVISGVFGTGYCLYPLFWDKVYAGVALEGVDMGGRSREDVERILRLWQKEQRNRQLVAYFGDSSFKLSAGKIDFEIDVEATAEEVWSYGRKGTVVERLKNIRTAAREGYRVPAKIRYNEGKLHQLMEEWREAIDKPPRNATISVLTGDIIPQEQGRKLETPTLRTMLVQALRNPDAQTIALPVTLLYPEITVADLSQTGIREALGTYTTKFDPKDAHRAANVKLAARKINGYIIYPGQTFSFNEVVGPRDKAHGFKEALEIVDGEFVPGVGGGVCQVSSTLYNAVLLSNLDIVERHNHSKPLLYVPLGRDATVVYDALDFKCANRTDTPVMIMAETKDGNLCVGVFGQRRMKETVEIISTDRQVLQPSVIKKQDQELFLGETKVAKQGKPGYEVTTVRVVRAAGRETKREILSRDRYLPEDTVVKVGVRLPPFAENAP